MKKRIISIISFLAVLATFAVAVPSAMAANLGIWGPEVARKGETINVTISVSGLSGVAPQGVFGFGPLDVQYDTSKYEYLGFKKSDKVPADYSLTVNPSANNNAVLVISGYANSNPIDPFAVSFLSLQFKVKDNAQNGASSFTITRWEGWSDGDAENHDNLPLGGSVASIKIEDPLPGDTTLASLAVTGYKISPAFAANKRTGYSLTVPTDVTEVNIEAKANDAKAKVAISGNKKLTEGANNVYVTVTAQNGTSASYIIAVTRTPGEKPDDEKDNEDNENKDDEENPKDEQSKEEITDEELQMLKDELAKAEEKYDSLRERFVVMAIVFACAAAAMASYIIYFLATSSKKKNEIKENKINEEEKHD